MSNIFDVIDIEDKIGVVFSDKTLLKQSFTHSSFANEQKVKSNESLEFLGDSILNFVVAEHLFNKYPEAKEGELSMLRSFAVSAKPLAEAVERMKLGEHMFLGAGEARSDKNKENIHADLFEAITAAIYLDKDFQTAKKFILTALKNNLVKNPVECKIKDFKTALQEYVQKNKKKLRYEELSRKGPDHDPIFEFAVFVDEKRISSGTGKSKRDAQQKAAEAALKKLK